MRCKPRDGMACIDDACHSMGTCAWPPGGPEPDITDPELIRDEEGLSPGEPELIQKIIDRELRRSLREHRRQGGG